METVSRLALTFLLNSLWQVTGVACVAGLCVWLMRNAPARYRHVIWVMALAVSVLLPIESVLSSWTTGSFPTLVSATANHRRLQSSPVLPGQARSGVERADMNNGWAWKTVGSAGILDFTRHRGHTITISPYLSIIVLGIYVLSLAFQSRRLCRAWRKTIAIGRSGYAREIPAAIAGAATRCLTTLGLRNVPILASASAVGPMTLGARRPVIILPEPFFQEASAEEAISVLAHETAHIARRDFLMNLIYEMVALPISFHPAAALLKRRINETRELACDEIATARITSASDYARSLVALARKMSAPPAFPRSGYLLGVFDANILEERIMSMLDQKRRLNARLAKATLVLGAFMMAASCIFASAFSLSISQGTCSQGDEALKPFAGTWAANLKGRPTMRLTLRIDEHKAAGTITAYSVKLDDDGNPVEAGEKSHEWNITGSRVDGKTVTLTGEDNEGVSRKFSLIMTGEREADFKVVGAPPPPGQSDNHPGLKLTKETEANSQIPGDLNAFAGTWQNNFKGKPEMIVTLRVTDHKLVGKLTVYRHTLDANGHSVAVSNDSFVCSVADVRVYGSDLSFHGDCPGGQDVRIGMHFPRERVVDFGVVGAPPPPGQSDDNSGVEPFVGTWEAFFEGKPFTTLKLVLAGNRLTGLLSPCRITVDANGKLTSAERNEQGGGWQIVEAVLDGSQLMIKAKEEGSKDIDRFEMKLTGDNDAQFKPSGSPMSFEPWKMVRASDKSSGALPATPAGRYAAVLRAVQIR